MAEDSLTEVTRQSWFGRIGGAFMGVFLGAVLFVAAFPLLFWNEGRAVKEYKTLKEGAGVVLSIPVETVSPANEGKLVHVTGQAVTDEKLSDPVFGVSATALKLKRGVAMYQWKQSSRSETKKHLGGSAETVTTYTYDKEWSPDLIHSGSFKKPEGHRNPDSMPYLSQEWAASDVTLGAFKLSPSLVGKIGNFSPLPLKSEASLPDDLKGKAKVQGSGLYIGGDPGAPEIGDLKVSFEEARPTEVSLIAQQVKGTFAPYIATTGKTIELLDMGVHNSQEMFQSAQRRNTVLTWILRAVGFFVMFVGLSMIFKPLSVLADIVPFVGSIVGAGTGLISFLIAAGLSLVTVAVAWVVYRPLLGILLFVVAAALGMAVHTRLRQAKPCA